MQLAENIKNGDLAPVFEDGTKLTAEGKFELWSQIHWVWLFCIFPYDDPVVAILLIRLLRVYLIILRWPVFLVDDFEFVVAGTESSA